MESFSSFKFDLLSFLLGFIAATLVYWLFSRIRKWFPGIKNFVSSQIKKFQDRSLINVEQILRQDVILRSQKNHLLASLCSLDEILIQPRLLVPPELLDFDIRSTSRTITDSYIPFFPESVEITSQYSYPTISLIQSIQKGANLVIYSPLSTGKTVALAHLASLLARKDPSSGNKLGCFPIYLQASDLIPNLPENADPFTQLVDLLTPWYPLLIRKRIPVLLKEYLQEDKLILILDGLDELPQEQLVNYTKFLEILSNKYPKVQLIVSCSSTNFGGLLGLGFIPVPLASWSQKDREEFIQKWGQVWKTAIAPNLSLKAVPEIDLDALNSLVDRSNLSITPLEWTIRLWSLYSGDIKDNSTISAIDAFTHRNCRDNKSFSALQKLALKMFQNKTSFIPIESVDLLLQPAGPDNQPTDPETKERVPSTRKGGKLSITSGVIDEWISNGILTLGKNGVMKFSHSCLLAYLASLNLEETSAAEESEEVWCVYDCYLQYLAAQRKLFHYVEERLYTPQAPLYSDIFRIARWIKDTPLDTPWRAQLLRLLVQLIHRDDLPFNLRCGVLSAFICTGDAGVPILLRQIISSASPQVRQLAAMGCGAIKDEKSLINFQNLLTDDFPDVQITAVLAIGLIETSASWKILEALLQSGDERISQAASEILATDPIKGHEILRNAAESEQILIRRSAVIGLGFIKEDWARQTIERLAVQDSQWVVRNIAGQTLENLKREDAHVPSRLVEEHNSHWLLTFAARKDQSIPVGKPPFDLLIDALQTGTPDEKLSALSYFRKYYSDLELQKALMNSIHSDNMEITQAAINTLWFFSRSSKAQSA